jgi:hypothetical protein
VALGHQRIKRDQQIEIDYGKIHGGSADSVGNAAHYRRVGPPASTSPPGAKANMRNLWPIADLSHGNIDLRLLAVASQASRHWI